MENNTEVPDIKEDKKAMNLKTRLIKWRIGKPKRAHIPIPMWKQIIKLTEIYPTKTIADELEISTQTLSRNIQRYSPKLKAKKKVIEPIPIHTPPKVEEALVEKTEEINLVRLPTIENPAPPTLKTMAGEPVVIAEITNRSGSTVRIFSGADSETVKLLASLV